MKKLLATLPGLLVFFTGFVKANEAFADTPAAICKDEAGYLIERLTVDPATAAANAELIAMSRNAVKVLSEDEARYEEVKTDCEGPIATEYFILTM